MLAGEQEGRYGGLEVMPAEPAVTCPYWDPKVEVSRWTAVALSVQLVGTDRAVSETYSWAFWPMVATPEVVVTRLGVSDTERGEGRLERMG